MAAVRQIAVTGGGTGIGKAIAGAVAQDGNVVVITGRRPEPTADLLFASLALAVLITGALRA